MKCRKTKAMLVLYFMSFLNTCKVMETYRFKSPASTVRENGSHQMGGILLSTETGPRTIDVVEKFDSTTDQYSLTGLTR